MALTPSPEYLLGAPGIHLFQSSYERHSRVYCLWSLEGAYPEDQLRYHLGQVSMLSLMNALANSGFKVTFVICDPLHQKLPNSQTKEAKKNVAVTRQFLEILKDESIDILVLSDEISRLQHVEGELFRTVRDTVRDGFTSMRDFIREHRFSDRLRNALGACRSYTDSPVWPNEVEEYADVLAQKFPGVSKTELMASVYATVRAPKWFNSDWIGEVCAWLVITAKDEPGAVIVEANRGAYSWLTHKCLLRVGLIERGKSIDHFDTPSNCFLYPVLSCTSGAAMELSDRAGCVFIDDSEPVILNQLALMNSVARESVLMWLRGSGVIGAGAIDWPFDVARFLASARGRIEELTRRANLQSAQGAEKHTGEQATGFLQTSQRPQNQVVMSVHGIRTHAPWQKSITTALGTSGFRHVPFDYGRLGIFAFLSEFQRSKIIEKFIQFYSQNGFGKANPPSVVAHSFGSYIVCRALEDYMDVYFNNVILMGSIVSRTFNWSKVVTGGRVARVLNEIAPRDLPVRFANWVIPDAESSGAEGFSDEAGGAVVQRRHEKFDHSQALNPLAFQTSWPTFLRTGQV